jgi:hypothetical protein
VLQGERKQNVTEVMTRYVGAATEFFPDSTLTISELSSLNGGIWREA